MTIVIATRGIDLSVGAVMAVTGAVTLTMIDGSPNPGSVSTVPVAIAAGLAVAFGLGMWNGMLVAVLKIQPIIATLVLMLAGRGVALLITGGYITTVNSPPLKFVASGYILGPALRLHPRRGGRHRRGSLRATDGPRRPD